MMSVREPSTAFIKEMVIEIGLVMAYDIGRTISKISLEKKYFGFEKNNPGNSVFRRF